MGGGRALKKTGGWYKLYRGFYTGWRNVENTTPEYFHILRKWCFGTIAGPDIEVDEW